MRVDKRQMIERALRREEADPEARRALIERIDTRKFQRGETPTVALIVFNPSEESAGGVAAFCAAFRIRAEVGPQPVTVRDEEGWVVPSRIVEETVGEVWPDGRRHWTLEMHFLTSEIPARGWRAYGVSYGYAKESEAGFGTDDSAPLPFLSVEETDCHPGDLPPVCSLYDIMEPMKGQEKR